MRARRTALLLTLALCVLPLRAEDDSSLDVPRREGEFVRVIIRYRDLPPGARRGGAPTTTAFHAATDEVERAGAKVGRRFTRLLSGVSATVRRSDLAAIRALPAVASVERAGQDEGGAEMISYNAASCVTPSLPHSCWSPFPPMRNWSPIPRTD